MTQRLPAGHSLLVRGGRPEVRRWWTPEFVESPDAPNTEQLVNELLSRLENSMAARLDADVRVGAYLSSGVDSSLLVSLASRRQPVETFSIGFEGATGSLDELSAARGLAEQLGARHHEQVITPGEYWDLLPHNIIACQEGSAARATSREPPPPWSSGSWAMRRCSASRPTQPSCAAERVPT